MVDEKGTGCRKIAELEIRIWIVKELVLARGRRAKQGNLENQRNTLTGGKSASGSLVVRGITRGRGHEAKRQINDDRRHRLMDCQSKR
jgi:hypothetical protein